VIAITDHALIAKLLENQSALISAFARASTAEELSVLEAIAETQYMIAEGLIEVEVTIEGPDDFPVTMQ
jgi:hypothetical protein